MPVLAIPFSLSSGVQVQAQITISRPRLLHLRQTRQSIPPPVSVIAILDTGAERTCVDPAVIARLNLPNRTSGFAAAPGVSTGPAIFGGASFSLTYEAGLVILHPVTKPPSNLIVHELEVDELPLAQFGIEAVIGRDVLASCVLVYNGPAGSVTLAY
ncbi:MAG: hypothetical protein L0241_19795 [Planctomycetia bacterium]|nr:hypothetical protein [Planctomycetia bacterium]